MAREVVTIDLDSNLIIREKNIKSCEFRKGSSFCRYISPFDANMLLSMRQNDIYIAAVKCKIPTDGIFFRGLNGYTVKISPLAVSLYNRIRGIKAMIEKLPGFEALKSEAKDCRRRAFLEERLWDYINFVIEPKTDCENSCDFSKAVWNVSNAVRTALFGKTRGVLLNGYENELYVAVKERDLYYVLLTVMKIAVSISETGCCEVTVREIGKTAGCVVAFAATDFSGLENSESILQPKNENAFLFAYAKALCEHYGGTLSFGVSGYTGRITVVLQKSEESDRIFNGTFSVDTELMRLAEAIMEL